ncbi:ABC transporter substrate-binding protein [Pelagicoccus sp. SDUM812002]|uniref:ABC transporter substrate-binding protein n=1 Tax=Pelagicoccus sp. SDUM812002 TaxID=3041266 RepID=UPI00280DB878|nr:ABC transporter substrate-binding protein [Pelagicoccus sp. SDUM812002]MDQ8187389.1 ABC transporter substrate-binding protein [Pelagicoccus sp. SDUM812002]
MMKCQIALCLVLTLFALAGCGPKADTPNEAPQVFVFARGSDAQKLDPADIDDGESVNTLTQICEGLVRFKSGTLEIEPWLAESYSVSPDGLVYRFKIREGVQFHDGTPLDAEAAAFSFLRQMDESHPAHLPEAAFSYWSYLYQDVVAVEAVAKMELEIRLSQANASMLRSLAIFPAWLISPSSLDTYGSEMQRNPIGTGPYRLKEWRRNEAVILERNPDYWGEAPAFERLVLKVVPDNTTRLLQLKSGAIHGMDGLQPTEVAALRNDPNLTVYEEAGLNVGYMAFNLETERLSHLELRKAIALGTDKQAFATVALEGAGRPASYPLPKGFLGYPSVEDKIIYDLERARKLAAPFVDLFRDKPLEILVMNAPRPYLPDPVTAATFMKGQIEAIGIPAKVVSLDFKTQLDRLRNGDFETALIGWVGDNGDTDNFLSVFFGSWAAEKGTATNYSFYRNPEMDELLLTARKTTKTAERAELYEEAIAIWKRDLPLLPLCHGDNIVVLSSQFEGFQLQKIGDLRLSEIRVK